jgi:hypothetical protein
VVDLVDILLVNQEVLVGPVVEEVLLVDQVDLLLEILVEQQTVLLLHQDGEMAEPQVVHLVVVVVVVHLLRVVEELVVMV